jgi:hypothetical protein
MTSLHRQSSRTARTFGVFLACLASQFHPQFLNVMMTLNKFGPGYGGTALTIRFGTISQQCGNMWRWCVVATFDSATLPDLQLKRVHNSPQHCSLAG